jgi:ribonuclease Z
MAAQIQIVTVPTADTPGTTLVLNTTRRNYIFGNQAEGTQRALTEMGVRLTKVQDFFITGTTAWSNMGGLVGMALTLADSAATSYEGALEQHRRKGKKDAVLPPKPKLNLYGPPNLKHMLATCRRFIFRKGLPIIATEYKAEAPAQSADGSILPSFENEDIQVWALSITPPATSEDADAEAALAVSAARYDGALNQFEEFKRVEGESRQDRDARYDRIRTEVLGHMFDSTWNYDTLVERHISEVEMPTVMYIRNPSTRQLETYKGPMPGGTEPLPDIKVLTRTPWPGAMVLDLPPTKPAPESVSYIVRTYKVRGKFDVERAKALGIKPGVAYKNLASGQSVQNGKGETITPDMVLGPDRPGQGVAILDVPTLGHLEGLVQREEFTSSSVMEGVQACIWILGAGLSRHPTLMQFMQKLDQIKHVISSADECPNRLALHSAATQTVHLNQIDADRYRVPFHDNTTLPQKKLFGNTSQEGELLSEALVADRGLKFRLMPTFAIDKENVLPLLDISDIEKSTSAEIIELAKAAQDNIARDQEAERAWSQLLSRPDTEVITLGTGSALPSKYRNVSATLVRVPGIGNYLLDCGENTLGQLQRVFNPDELVEVLRNLRMIWISHLHADHHLGTASVIRAWYAIVHNSVPAPMPPSMSSISDSLSVYGLSVVSHDGMLKWLSEYASVEDFGYSRILPLKISPATEESEGKLAIWPFYGPEVHEGEHVLQRKDYEAVLGVSDIQACRVSHCHGAMAVSLTFPDAPEDAQLNKKPLKVSYSGDCRPSGQFAHMGKDTTVLIHEATFDDELAADARHKKHSTTSEALGIGAKMGAKAVVLTHFSQRYQKIPVLETVDNGDGDGDVAAEPAVDALPTEDVAPQDQDVEMTDDPTVNVGNVDAAYPTDGKAAKKDGGPLEKVVKVRARDMKVAIAFDYMRVRIGDVAKMDKFNPALEKLLADDEEKDAAGVGEGEEEKINGNGKKTSPEAGSGRKKKAKRNN